MERTPRNAQSWNSRLSRAIATLVSAILPGYLGDSECLARRPVSAVAVECHCQERSGSGTQGTTASSTSEVSHGVSPGLCDDARTLAITMPERATFEVHQASLATDFLQRTGRTMGAFDPPITFEKGTYIGAQLVQRR